MLLFIIIQLNTPIILYIYIYIMFYIHNLQNASDSTKQS